MRVRGGALGPGWRGGGEVVGLRGRGGGAVVAKNGRWEWEWEQRPRDRPNNSIPVNRGIHTHREMCRCAGTRARTLDALQHVVGCQIQLIQQEPVAALERGRKRPGRPHQAVPPQQAPPDQVLERHAGRKVHAHQAAALRAWHQTRKHGAGAGVGTEGRMGVHQQAPAGAIAPPPLTRFLAAAMIVADLPTPVAPSSRSGSEPELSTAASTCARLARVVGVRTRSSGCAGEPSWGAATGLQAGEERVVGQHTQRV